MGSQSGKNETGANIFQVYSIYISWSLTCNHKSQQIPGQTPSQREFCSDTCPPCVSVQPARSGKSYRYPHTKDTCDLHRPSHLSRSKHFMKLIKYMIFITWMLLALWILWYLNAKYRTRNQANLCDMHVDKFIIKKCMSLSYNYI